MTPQTPEQKLHDATQALTAAHDATTRAQTRRDETIRDLIHTHGYTKYRVAQLAGLSQTLIARIVNQETQP